MVADMNRSVLVLATAAAMLVGPGYTYAGCLFSKCDPGNLKNGQIDGILYQVGRLLGVMNGPACGPSCTLAAPAGPEAAPPPPGRNPADPG